MLDIQRVYSVSAHMIPLRSFRPIFQNMPINSRAWAINVMNFYMSLLIGFYWNGIFSHVIAIYLFRNSWNYSQSSSKMSMGICLSKSDPKLNKAIKYQRKHNSYLGFFGYLIFGLQWIHRYDFIWSDVYKYDLSQAVICLGHCLSNQIGKNEIKVRSFHFNVYCMSLKPCFYSRWMQINLTRIFLFNLMLIHFTDAMYGWPSIWWNYIVFFSFI